MPQHAVNVFDKEKKKRSPEKMHFKSIIKGEAFPSIYADWVNGGWF